MYRVIKQTQCICCGCIQGTQCGCIQGDSSTHALWWFYLSVLCVCCLESRDLFSSCTYLWLNMLFVCDKTKHIVDRLCADTWCSCVAMVTSDWCIFVWYPVSMYRYVWMCLFYDVMVIVFVGVLTVCRSACEDVAAVMQIIIDNSE